MITKNKDINCSKCGKKIAEGDLTDGIISIKCKCGVINTITAKPKQAFQNRLNLEAKGSEEIFTIKQL